jgi:hypothetical protein
MLFATNITDIEHVALVSVWFALFIQICPALLLITSRCSWLQSAWAITIALLLVLLPPLAEEVWLSPVTSQYHLMVCAALILAFDIATGPLLIVHTILLILASLTGPGPALLSPLFLLRAWHDRSWQRLLYAGIMVAGAVIEIIVFCTHPVPDRHLAIDASLLMSVIYLKHLLLPFFGTETALRMGRALMREPSSIPIVVTCIAFVGLAVAVCRTASHDVRWLFAAALTLMVLSYLGSLGNKTSLLNAIFGQRYYYAPQVLLGITLLGIARTGPTIVRRIALVTVGWLVVVGGLQYLNVHQTMARGPAWREQVGLWRSDPHHPLVLWPATMQIRL